MEASSCTALRTQMLMGNGSTRSHKDAQPHVSTRTVAHAAHMEMDCFYVQVEQRKQPQLLRGSPRPAAAVQQRQYNPRQGGALIAVSYGARRYGLTWRSTHTIPRTGSPEVKGVNDVVGCVGRTWTPWIRNDRFVWHHRCNQAHQEFGGMGRRQDDQKHAVKKNKMTTTMMMEEEVEEEKKEKKEKKRASVTRSSRDRTGAGHGGRSARVLLKESSTWRMYGVNLLVDEDAGKDVVTVTPALRDVVAKRLGCQASLLNLEALSVVRKSFDARKDPPRFRYIVDIDGHALTCIAKLMKPQTLKLKVRPSKLEVVTKTDSVQNHGREKDRSAKLSSGTDVLQSEGATTPSGPSTLSGSLITPAADEATAKAAFELPADQKRHGARIPVKKEGGRVIVVGSGPAGLFAALAMAEAGVGVVMIERGQPVEVRGRDIGALIARRKMNPHSNFCYGEGGAGTWSDGKLTTRIGRNRAEVHQVLETLVQFGGPERIMVDGKPHLGTDRLVRILRNFRHYLEDVGVDIRFGTVVEDLVVRDGRVVGVQVRPTGAEKDSGGTSDESYCLEGDAVVLGVGHSAREVYDMLSLHGVSMSAKDFAVGLRVEHPQELINKIQYGEWASKVERGKGKVPVADYSLAVEVGSKEDGAVIMENRQTTRNCYSFCMCPGGQVVPTSTNEWELCVNGMSFSQRSSPWANSALVVGVGPRDFEPFEEEFGALAGVALQRALEREAALRGGGGFVAPVQTVPDFIQGSLSATLPSSSYRLGVKSSRLDELFPAPITNALREALAAFDKMLPGFIDNSALLHGVETRTSAPVRVNRDADFQSISTVGLYPIGEGAGYAGGIMSAAVDGLQVGSAIAAKITASTIRPVSHSLYHSR